MADADESSSDDTKDEPGLKDSTHTHTHTHTQEDLYNSVEIMTWHWNAGQTRSLI